MDKVWILDFEADTGAGDYVGYVSAHATWSGAVAQLKKRFDEIAPGLFISTVLPVGEPLFDDVEIAGWDVTYSLYQIDLQD
jgi:hypothetical protein